MKGFGKGLSPSKPNANRNLSPSGPVENNENDSSVDKLISQFENHKNINGKHFMPRVPRKDILAEIHGILSDAQNHENPNLGLDKSPSKSGVNYSVMLGYSHASEQKDNVSSKAYDPLTNYLTPRPKYLRFDPNRRREILKRLENECREELDISPNSVETNDDEELSENMVEDTSLSPPKVCVEDPRNGGTSEEGNDNVVDGYEAEDEDEEERGWCVRGVLKVIALMIACLLSTSYICSLNSPTVSPIQQTVWNLTDKNGPLEFVRTKMQDDGGIVEVEVGGDYRLIEEVEVDEESYGKVDEIVEGDEENNDEEIYGEISESFEAEILENLERFEREMIRNENEYSKEMVDVAAEFEFKADEYEPLIDAKTNENLVRFERGMIRNENKYSNEMVDAAAEFEFKADEYEPLIDAKTNENIDDGVILDEEVESSYMCSNEYEASETEIVLHGELSDSTDEDAEVRKERSEWNTETVVGISATLIILSSIAIIHHSKKSRSTSSCKVFEPAEKQHSTVEENVLPSIERKVEFLAREAPRELPRHIHAPTVEFIGEIVVGKPTNRKKSSKNKSVSEDQRNANSSLPRPLSTLSQPSATELHPTTSNTSYGSFTTEMKMPTEEGSQSGEAMIGTTPVRRSNRIHNRSAVISS